MQVDLSKEILDLEGKPMPRGEAGSSSNMTVADVILICLNTPLEGDEKDSGEQRIRKFDLMQNITKSKMGKLKFEAQDITLVKERVLKVFPNAMVYGRICEALGEKK